MPRLRSGARTPDPSSEIQAEPDTAITAEVAREDRFDSDLVSEEAVLHLRQLAPHAEYTDIADATHMVVGDANDAFSAAIVDFLGRYHSSDTAQPQGTREL